MANASVDKLKTMGLRHGEKVGVALTAALCGLFLFMAATKETIDLTPEQVSSDADAANKNINRKQDPADILKRLEEAGIKNPEFEKKVDDQAKNLLVASDFKTAHAWVYPQPGAGLIRDMPELIAPTELVAYPGRGGLLVYDLDPDTGKRVIEEEKPEAPVPAKRLGRRRRRRGGAAAEDPKKAEAEEKERVRQQRIFDSKFAGKEKENMAATEPVAEEPEGPFKEITKGYRWVVVTGVLDYKKLRENYVNALKRPEVAYPHFKRLDLERQVLEPDGTWTPWEPIDFERNNQVLYNHPEEDEEYVPETARFSALVDPLPLIMNGLWKRAHVISLVPEEKRELAPLPAAASSSSGYEGGMSSSSAAAAAAAMVNQARQIQSEGGMSSSSSSYASGGGRELMDFEKSDVDTLMVRALDFTVETDKTYRFRTRIIVFNPNRGREDVSPGVDNKSAELVGPWSDPTEEVTMPADVTAYAMKKAISADKRSEKINFQVTRWNPEDGLMVVKEFPASPGEVIGDNVRLYVPTTDGSGKKPETRRIDFTSHQVVLDAMGGDQTMPPIQAGNRFEVPTLSLLIRPDGSVIVRDQSIDSTDQVRKDIETTFKREMEESNKKPSLPGPQ